MAPPSDRHRTADHPAPEPDPPAPPRDYPDGLQVVGLGRTGLAVALLAASRGLGPIALWDPAPVTAEDLGTGYLPADLGRPRALAAERRLTELRPDVRVFADRGRAPVLLGSATVSVTRKRIDEALAARALAAGHPLLPVMVAEVSAVGPWTVAGAPGCALCALDAECPPWPPPCEEKGEPESVVGALRTAVHVHDALLEGTAGVAWRGLLWSWGFGMDESSIGVRPRPGCPCDPDGLAAELAALTEEPYAGETPWSSSITSWP